MSERRKRAILLLGAIGIIGTLAFGLTQLMWVIFAEQLWYTFWRDNIWLYDSLTKLVGAAFFFPMVTFFAYFLYRRRNGAEQQVESQPCSSQSKESKENMKSKRNLEVEKIVEQKELVERLLTCRRVALAKLAGSKGDGYWIWHGRLAAYNETLAAIQGDREALLQFTVLTEENLELAKKLSENLDGKKPQEANT